MKREDYDKFLGKKKQLSKYMEVYENFVNGRYNNKSNSLYSQLVNKAKEIGLNYDHRIISNSTPIKDPNELSGGFPTYDTTVSESQTINFTNNFFYTSYINPYCYGYNVLVEIALNYTNANIKIGFYTYTSPVNTLLNSSTETYIPTIYYESATGNIYFGTVLIRTITANLKTLMLSFNSIYNVYIGESTSKYYLIGNLLTNKSLININSYSIRLGMSIETNGDTGYAINYNTSYTETPIYSYPNFRFYSNSENDYVISGLLNASDDMYRISKIFNYRNGTSELGKRIAFTLKCLQVGIDYFILVINGPSTFTDTATTNSLSGYINSTTLYYDSLQNKYIYGNESYTPASYPDITNIGGQIYVRVDENLNVYSSRDSSTAVTIRNITGTTLNSMYIITYNYISSVNVNYEFILDNVTPVVDNPTPTLVPITTGVDLPNNAPILFVGGSDTIFESTPDLNKYYTLIWGQSLWKRKQYMVISITSTNPYKIGYYGGNTKQYNDVIVSNNSENAPFFYYNSSDGNVFMGNDNVGSLNANLTQIFMMIDETGNFYMGPDKNLYYLFGNIDTYTTLLNNNYGCQYSYEFYSNNIDGYTTIITEGFIDTTLPHTIDYLNNKLYEASPSLNNIVDKYILTNNTSTFIPKYKYYQILNFPNNSITVPNSGYNVSYTIRADENTTFDNTLIIIYCETDYMTTYNEFDFSQKNLIYNTNTNFYEKNGVALQFQPVSYPNLNSAGGQMYIEFNSNGNIYSGRDSSNKRFIATCDIVGQSYSYIVSVNNTTNINSTKFSIIPNNVQAIVPNPYIIPLASSTPLPTSDEAITLINDTSDTDTFTLTNLKYYKNLREYPWGYGSAYLFIIDRGSCKYTLGFYTKSVEASTPTSFSTSSYYPQFYYDSSNGNIYFGTDIKLTIWPNLSSIAIGISTDADTMFIGTSFTNYWTITGISTYTSLWNESLYGACRFGYTVERQTSTDTFSIRLIDGKLYYPLSSFILYPSIRGMYTLGVNPKVFDLDKNYNVGFTVIKIYEYLNGYYRGNPNVAIETTIRNNTTLTGVENIYIVFYSNTDLIVDNVYSSFPLTNNYFMYNAKDNTFSLNGTLQNFLPSSYPDLLSLDGQAYYSVDNNGDVYFSRDHSNRTLIQNINLVDRRAYIIIEAINPSSNLILSFNPNDTQEIVDNPPSALGVNLTLSGFTQVTGYPLTNTLQCDNQSRFAYENNSVTTSLYKPLGSNFIMNFSVNSGNPSLSYGIGGVITTNSDGILISSGTTATMFFSYKLGTGQVYFREKSVYEQLITTIDSGISNCTFFIDENLNFYIANTSSGIEGAFGVKICNINDFYPGANTVYDYWGLTGISNNINVNNHFKGFITYEYNGTTQYSNVNVSINCYNKFRNTGIYTHYYNALDYYGGSFLYECIFSSAGASYLQLYSYVFIKENTLDFEFMYEISGEIPIISFIIGEAAPTFHNPTGNVLSTGTLVGYHDHTAFTNPRFYTAYNNYYNAPVSFRGNTTSFIYIKVTKTGRVYIGTSRVSNFLVVDANAHTTNSSSDFLRLWILYQGSTSRTIYTLDPVDGTRRTKTTP